MLRLGLALAILVGTPAARAALVTVEFEAVVTVVRDDFGLLPGIEPGSQVSGAMVLDDSVQPEMRPGGWRFDLSGVAEAGFRFRVGDLSFELLNSATPQAPFTVFQDDFGYLASLTGSSDASSLEGLAYLIIAGDEPFPAPELLPPDLSGARQAPFTFFAREVIEDGQVLDSGFFSDLTSLRVAPEPTALALLGLATAGLLAARRRH